MDNTKKNKGAEKWHATGKIKKNNIYHKVGFLSLELTECGVSSLLAETPSSYFSGPPVPLKDVRDLKSMH